jgi:hypothetical protein
LNSLLAFNPASHQKGVSVESILDKLSSYNLFNYLLPGVILCVVSDRYFDIPLLQDSIITGLFFYYFVGLITSRFGSIVLEPILKKLKIVKFAAYSDFLKAVKNDQKVEVLSEANNMYRSLISALVILCLLVAGEKIIHEYESLSSYYKYALLPALLILFVFSYRKQSEYIVKRINSNNESSD